MRLYAGDKAVFRDQKLLRRGAKLRWPARPLWIRLRPAGND
jgi:hypothetical protein